MFVRKCYQKYRITSPVKILVSTQSNGIRTFKVENYFIFLKIWIKL